MTVTHVGHRDWTPAGMTRVMTGMPPLSYQCNTSMWGVSIDNTQPHSWIGQTATSMVAPIFPPPLFNTCCSQLSTSPFTMLWYLSSSDVFLLKIKEFKCSQNELHITHSHIIYNILFTSYNKFTARKKGTDKNGAVQSLDTSLLAWTVSALWLMPRGSGCTRFQNNILANLNEHGVVASSSYTAHNVAVSLLPASVCRSMADYVNT